MSLRSIKKVITPRKTSDGAGVNLERVFSHGETDLTDPFLLLDHLKNLDPEKPMPGFPWHPHRGIETITYVLQGGIQHEDSMGNKGDLRDGDVQWMTAGRGIIHQEMPIPGEVPIMHGFQLWSNLPSSHKMMSPRYQDIPSVEIPELREDSGTIARLITGNYKGKTGPVSGIVTDPTYIDFSIPARKELTIKIDVKQNAFAYIFEGSGHFPGASEPFGLDYSKSLILFDSGDEIKVTAGDKGIRFLLISGRPLRESIAWHGPIVMNTREELIQAFEEYEKGDFVK